MIPNHRSACRELRALKSVRKSGDPPGRKYKKRCSPDAIWGIGFRNPVKDSSILDLGCERTTIVYYVL